MLKKIALAILCIFVFASCINGLKTSTQIAKEEVKILKANEMVGREFIIETEEYKAKKLTIGFTKDKIFGFSGINRYFSKYKISNNKLIIDNIGVTKVAGNKEKMVSELKFLSLLRDNKEIKLEGDYLILISNEGLELKFRDIRVPEETVEVKK